MQDVCLQAQLPTPQSAGDTPTFPTPSPNQRRGTSTKRSSAEPRTQQTTKLRRVQSGVNPSEMSLHSTSIPISQSDSKKISAACADNQSDFSCTSFDEESDFCQVLS